MKNTTMGISRFITKPNRGLQARGFNSIWATVRDIIDRAELFRQFVHPDFKLTFHPPFKPLQTTIIAPPIYKTLEDDVGIMGCYSLTYVGNLHEWVVKDDRLTVIVNPDRVGAINRTIEYVSHASISRINVVTTTLIYETLFEGQKFLPYIKFDPTLDINDQDFIWGTMYGVDGLPTRERLVYLTWKHYLQGWCEHHELRNEVNVPLKVLDAVDQTGNVDVQSLRNKLWLGDYRHSDKTFDFTITMLDGQKINSTIHMHEIQVHFLATKGVLPPADKLSQKPKDRFKDVIKLLIEKKQQRYNQITPFLTLNLSDDRFKPIHNNQDLIQEGYAMHHCIGGENYIEEGLEHRAMFFRFIPKGVDVKDLDNQYTVTMVADKERHVTLGRYLDANRLPCSDIVTNTPHGISFLRMPEMASYDPTEYPLPAQISEVWGFKNRKPIPEVMHEIYCFIYDNREQFGYLFKP